MQSSSQINPTKKRFLSIQEQYENQQKMISLDFSNNIDSNVDNTNNVNNNNNNNNSNNNSDMMMTNSTNDEDHDMIGSTTNNDMNRSITPVNSIPTLQFHQLQPHIQSPVQTQQVQPQVQIQQPQPQVQPLPIIIPQIHNHQQQQQQQQQLLASQKSKLPIVVTKGKYSLNDFQIIRTLGTGSFGRVHLIRSVHNGRYYAMKVFRKRQVVKAKQIEHTNDERRILSVIQHPFITRMWGTFQDSKSIFMIMDYIEGGELFSLLRRSKNFPNQVAKFYAAEVLLALEYLHSKNIIYRDLKPENILLARSGHIKLTDFGFAKEVETKTYTLCGTPDYIAPEVIAVQPYNKAVDWWSFGILIYEMLSGSTPFYDVSPIKTYENITKCELRFNNNFFQDDSVDLLNKLITKDVTYRLGNLQNGVDDIKNHEWFKEVIWENLLQGNIETPYEPNIPSGVGDSSQFEIYPEENYDYGISGIADDFGYLFPEF